MTISSLRSSLTEKNNEIVSKNIELSSMRTEYNFYHDYAVIVQRGVTNYHRYGCSRLDYSYFWIYNKEAAEGLGYDPCPQCYSQKSIEERLEELRERGYESYDMQG